LPGFQEQRDEILSAVRRVAESGRYILGPEVEAFEREFAGYLGVAHAVGVASGTDAVRLALEALGVGAPDDVLTVSHTAVATVAAIVALGARPIFVDVEPETGLMNLDLLESSLTEQTKAVIGVHLYGKALDMDALSSWCASRGLKLIEDCAQAHGARWNGRRVGSFGDAAAFSFYPTKNLGALGDGGAVATNSLAIAERIRSLRQYGWEDRYVSAEPGINSRLDELQAAILRVKLRALDDGNARRRRIALRYLEAFEPLGIAMSDLSDLESHAFHLFVVSTPLRDELKAHLANNSVFAGIHYPVPVHLQPGYGEFPSRRELPVSERLADTVLSLPMYPELSQPDQDRVIGLTLSFFASQSGRKS
jgi:dTDP-4-amino-4,6-dideoxygalactose transaminase